MLTKAPPKCFFCWINKSFSSILEQKTKAFPLRTPRRALLVLQIDFALRHFVVRRTGRVHRGKFRGDFTGVHRRLGPAGGDRRRRNVLGSGVDRHTFGVFRAEVTVTLNESDALQRRRSARKSYRPT